MQGLLIESRAEGSDRWSKLRLASYLLRGIPGVPYPPGPLFFVMFINDLPDVVSPGSLVALYADDCKTSRAIQRPCDHESFQDDLNNLVSWSRLNHMSFTAKKWKLMRITEKRSPILAPLQLGDTTLEVTAEFSDLGLLTNHKLSWNSHIDKIFSKPNKVLGLIKRNCRNLKDVSTLRTCIAPWLGPSWNMALLFGHLPLPEILLSWKKCNLVPRSLF